MVQRNSLLYTFAGLGLATLVNGEYVWPNPATDYLEFQLYEQSGFQVNSAASFIAPCGKVPFGKGRSAPAEWLRTAYHDMATADVVAGTGGIDASIGYELQRDENPGAGFNETLGNLIQFMTPRSSMSDLIAMAALFAVEACSDGKIVIPYRGGRIDAGKAGPTGVPKPEEDLKSHTDNFKKQGFTMEEMIGLVACGHTLGGVHGVDFPEIVPLQNESVPRCPDNEIAAQNCDDQTQFFDDTQDKVGAFDNAVAVDFVNNKTTNPLAFGHNETTRSDHRIFMADGGEIIKKMAASNDYFLQTCQNLITRMIDTVPKTVKLTEVIAPIPVKPSHLFATINANKTMTFNGYVRLFDTVQPPNRKVKIHFRPAKGAKNTTALVDEAVAMSMWSNVMYGAQPLKFLKYGFNTNIALSHGVSAFDVEVIDTVSGKTNRTMYTNGGNGFPFDTAILPQAQLSCQEHWEKGLLNLTIATRDDLHLTSMKAVVYVPTPLKSYTPTLKANTVQLQKGTAVPGSGYTLWTGSTTGPVGDYTRTYDLVGSDGKKTYESKFHEMYRLNICPNEHCKFFSCNV